MDLIRRAVAIFKSLQESGTPTLVDRIAWRILPLVYTREKFAVYAARQLQLPDCSDTLLAIKYSRGQLVEVPLPLSHYFDQLFEVLKTHVQERRSLSVIRGGDGDGYFLQRRAIGNIPTRQYTKGDDMRGVDIRLFREGFLKCDLKLVEMFLPNQRLFQEVYGRNVFSDIPVECVYALIASRRLLKTPWSIGIIGNDHLLPVIQRLLVHPEYRGYIGRSAFQDYIPVPQRGAANEPLALAESIRARLRGDVQLYLVGMGSAKMAVLHRLAQDSNAVFLDVGVCIQALAGVVNVKRAYFADWVNFRLKDYDYGKVDTMLADMGPASGVIL